MAAFLISWFLVGFISALFAILYDMRGQEFDEDFFNGDNIFALIISIVLGYITLVIVAAICLKTPITKLLYKIANIGVNKSCETSKEETEEWVC